MINIGSSKGLDLESFTFEILRAMSTLPPEDYQFINQSRITTNVGRKASVHEWVLPGNEARVRILQLIIVHEGKAFVFSGQAVETKWNQYKDLLLRSLLTFEPL